MGLLLRSIPALFTVVYLTILFGAFPCRGYESGKCYCYKEMDDKLKSKTFKNTAKPARYQYIGVKVEKNGAFSPCMCEDVTRITTPYVFLDKKVNDDALDPTRLSIIIEKLTAAVSEASKDEPSFHSTSVAFKSVEKVTTTFTVEITVKGHETVPPGIILDILQKTSNSLVSALGATNEKKFNLKVLLCYGSPPRPPVFGKFDWPVAKTNGFPGEFATYSCDDTYVVKDKKLAFSMCSHDDLSWTDPKKEHTCLKGCSTEPPTAPSLSRKNWKQNENKEGDVVKYACIRDFRPVDGIDGTSTCVKSKWTALSKNFKCEQIFCPKQVPMNVDHGVVTGFRVDRPLIVGTVIKYSCKNGFCSNYDKDIPVTCSPRGIWIGMPGNFGCYPKHRFCLSFKDHQAKEATNKILTAVLFFTVALPGVIVLVLFLVCAISVVRIDSPMYWPCSEKAKKQSYKVYQY